MSASRAGGIDDAELNDVATMGGVNLAEENAQIMAAAGHLLQTATRRMPTDGAQQVPTDPCMFHLKLANM